ncbi:MAG: pyridoxal 5'-phosphate synthase glutaminase subunit PdxT [Anaerolineales bacterium]
MKIGVLALQGAFIEHARRVTQLGAEGVQVRLPGQLADLDGLIIPGGESTTIGKLAVKYELLEPLRDFAARRPVWGTCAGMIFLAKDIGPHEQPILGMMDMTVNRNAFGRQAQSFETDLPIEGLAGDPFHAVFIRAPLVTAVREDARAIAQLDPERIVAVRQGHWLATAFHPELTPDNRLHELFLEMVRAVA